MVEPIMYLAIGFLISTLCGLMIVPLVHNRAVRLTTRRLEAAAPLSMAEIQADKDQLRAEFAMSARKLEMNVEHLKAKTTSQQAELGKKTDAINRLKMELGEKSAAIFTLETREKALREQLQATEKNFSLKTDSLRDAEQALREKQIELTKLSGELTDRSQTAEARQDFPPRRLLQQIGKRGDIDLSHQRGSATRDLKSKSFGSSRCDGLVWPSARSIVSFRPGMRRSISASIAFIALRSSPSCEPQRSQGMIGNSIAAANFARSSSAA